MLANKKETYHLEEDAANIALQNILSACDKKPNSVPFEKLPRHHKRSTPFPIVMLILTGIVFLLTLFLPLYIKPLVQFAEPIFTEESILINDYVKDNVLYLEFSGNTLFYDQAYMKTNDDKYIPVLFYDDKTGMIAFPYYDHTESNIYIPTSSDEKLHFLITPDKYSE